VNEEVPPENQTKYTIMIHNILTILAFIFAFLFVSGILSLFKPTKKNGEGNTKRTTSFPLIRGDRGTPIVKGVEAPASYNGREEIVCSECLITEGVRPPRQAKAPEVKKANKKRQPKDGTIRLKPGKRMEVETIPLSFMLTGRKLRG
jgi:hypothetical protein